jgi:ADP-heptose:LPS heptosyltransferase
VSGRLVVLRALGLGDLLTAVPALRALADAFPRHRRILAAPAPLAPLALLSGAVDEVVDTGPLRPLSSVLAEPDVAVNLHGRGPESHRLLQALHPGRLIAFGRPDDGIPGPEWRADEHERERWCRLLRAEGIPARPERVRIARPPGDGPAGLTGSVVLHPGAAAAARRWPPDRFAAVARALTERGIPVVVTGSTRERGLAHEVASLSGLPDRAVLAGATDLTGLARVVAGARAVVSGDTGIAHLAVALGTPSVTLFGPSSPAHWGPPEGTGRHIALWSGGSGDPHAATPDAGLLRLRPSEVVRALTLVLDPSNPLGSRGMPGPRERIRA